MNYREMLHAIDSLKALEILGIQADTNGAYVRFPCPSKCDSPAIIKTYGDKKNLWYCPKCKTGGNLLKLTMDLKGIDYPAARDLLTKCQRECNIDPLWELNFDPPPTQEGIDGA